MGNPATDPRYKLGRQVVLWIERHCVYGQGDFFGKPVHLEPFQVRLILHLYELLPNGRRRYTRALFECPKGQGKTPLAAWVGLYELCHTPSALIPVAAASYKQADLLFADMADCVRESASLNAVLDAFEGEVQVRGGPAKAYKVAAVQGTNDGQRPSCLLADEIHEWLGPKATVHVILENGASKRADGFTLNTTTPGFDAESLAGKLHTYGVKVNTGEIDDPTFLFVWYGCPEDRYDITDELLARDPAGFAENLRKAVIDANPAAASFLNVDRVCQRFHQIDRHQFCRYHLGLWTSVHKLWLSAGAWDGLARPDRVIEPGTPVVLALDGSYNSDSTALSVVTCETVPHIDVAGLWELPEDTRAEWLVPILDVEEAIRECCRRWQVAEVVCDPYRWARSIEVLEGEGFPMVAFPQTPARMVPATSRFEEAVRNGQLTHSGHPALARHIANAVIKEDVRGRRITKDTKHSTRRIDLAITAVMGLDRAHDGGLVGEPHIW